MSVTSGLFQGAEGSVIAREVFYERDNADAPLTVIVNETFARKWFPKEEAVGKRITFSDMRKPDVKWVTVVGIVGDMRHNGLDLEPKPEYYVAHAQNPYRGMILAIRSSQDPRALTSSIRNEIRRLDPELPAANVRTLEEVTSESIAPRRLSVDVTRGVCSDRVDPRICRHLWRDVVPGRAEDA